MSKFPYDFPFLFDNIQPIPLVKSILAETLSNGMDLKITDNSIYTEESPKSDFLNRLVTITFADGTFINKDFPYTGSNNDIKDSITYKNLLSKDSILNIKVTFVFKDDEDIPEEFTFNYLSNIISLKCRSTLAKSICGCDDCGEQLNLLLKIDSNIESSKYSALFMEHLKCQKFLDANTEICNSLKNKNCKSC